MTAVKSSDTSWIAALGRMRPWDIKAARDVVRDLPEEALRDVIRRLPARVDAVVRPDADEGAVEDIFRMAADASAVFQGREGVADLLAKAPAQAASWRAFLAATRGQAWPDVARALRSPAVRRTPHTAPMEGETVFVNVDKAARKLRYLAGRTRRSEQGAGHQVLTAEIVGMYVSNNSTSVAELPDLIRATHEALTDIGVEDAAPAEEVAKATPAQIRKSITPDALISFEDGKPYKTLKRHLTTHGMTVAEYKAKWGLPADYPTTAPAYSEARSAMAKALGLGSEKRKKTNKALAGAGGRPQRA